MDQIQENPTCKLYVVKNHYIKSSLKTQLSESSVMCASNDDPRAEGFANTRTVPTYLDEKTFKYKRGG